MGEVAAKIKIMPESIDTDLTYLKDNILKNLPFGCSIYGNWEIQPVAFGLKSLIVTIVVDDAEGGIEKVEESILNTDGAESIQILELGRL